MTTMKVHLMTPVFALMSLTLASGSWAAPTWGKPAIQPSAMTGETAASASNKNAVFSCDRSGAVAVTSVQFRDAQGVQSRPILNWVPQYYPDASEAAQLCQGVAEKLQGYYDRGDQQALALMTGKVDSQGVVCLQDPVQLGCNPSRVLFTLPAGEPASKVFYEMASEDLRPERKHPGTRGDLRMILDLRWLPF
ncbi:MAG: hypothetical protein HC890_14970 [Chloroflexaceae bacterium]|nr:hypothetical protein [Chloroflexaceae bacterium]